MNFFTSYIRRKEKRKDGTQRHHKPLRLAAREKVAPGRATGWKRFLESRTRLARLVAIKEKIFLDENGWEPYFLVAGKQSLGKP